MDNELRWDQVRYFVAVARAGSAVAAGQQLGVSHATVMRNVAQLEAHLGVRLFEHARSGYRITTDGEEILGSARAMEEHAEQLVRKASGKSPAPVGRLKLAVADSALYDPMPLLHAFQRAHPRIELVVAQPPRPTAAHAAEFQGEAAILVTNAPPDELVGRQIDRVKFGWFVAPGYTNRRTALKPDECAWVLWAFGASGELDEAWQRAQLRRLTPRPRVMLQTDTPSAALAAVQAGLGAALLSDVHAGALRRLPFAEPPESFGVWLLTHPDQRRAGRVRALFDFVANRAR